MRQKQLALVDLFPAQQISGAGTAQGTGINLQDYANPGNKNIQAHLSVGAQSGTTPTLDVKIQESDSLGSGYADISGAAFTQLGAATGEETIVFTTNKQYIRVSYTLGGTSPAYDFGVVVQLRPLQV